MKTKILTIIGIFIIVFLSISSVSAYKRLCLTDKQCTPSCSSTRHYTCEHDLCMVCVTDSGYPTDPNKCNNIVGCSSSGNSTPVDITALNLTIKDPDNNAIYSSRMVLFDLSTNKQASYYWLDDINGRGQWHRICSNCQSFNNGLSFQDGNWNITIKAVSLGQEVFGKRSFFVDSKSPIIRKTGPERNSLMTGNFYVEFKEENPKSLALYYGNKSKQLDLKNCTKDKKKTYCETNVNLGSYDGKEIEYWFVLKDIAGTSTESKHVLNEVDIKAPEIKKLNYTVNGKYVLFNIEINEKNFAEISYIDNSDIRPRWVRLCSRLDDNKCEKKKTFKPGVHNINIQVTDEAGWSTAKNIEFEIL